MNRKPQNQIALDRAASTISEASAKLSKAAGNGDNATRQQFDGERATAPAFRGSLDSQTDGQLIGWVAADPNLGARISVGAFLGNRLIATTTASVYRSDLEAAGIGDGRHGFVLGVPEPALNIARQTNKDISVRVLGQADFELGCFKPYQSVLDTSGPRFAMLQNLLYNDLELMGDLLEEHASEAPHGAPINVPSAYESLLAPSTYTKGEHDTVLGTQYLDYIRLRLKVSQFDIRSAKGSADLLTWYINGYGATQKGLRAPLSQRQLVFLNDPVKFGGDRFTLTRATWSSLVAQPALLQSIDLNSADWYRNIAYWWSIHRAKDLHVEDCLVPRSYSDTLRRVDGQWKGDAFPLSTFMELYFNESPAYHFLELHLEEERQAYSLALILHSIRRPDFYGYIPANTIDAAFARPGPASSSVFAGFVAAVSPEALSRQVEYDVFRELMAMRGYDTDARGFKSITRSGGRMHAAALPSPSAAAAVDVQVIGPFKKASGLGQATRLSAASLSRTRYSTNFVDFGLDNPAPEGYGTVGALDNYRAARVNVIHLNAESIPLAYAYAPDVFTGAYNIGYFFWELNEPAKCHYLALELLDEIWVSSEYGVAVYRGHTAKPVVNVGMSVQETPRLDRSKSRGILERRYLIDRDKFVFLVVFDSFSFIQRKNPLGAVRAFQLAFPGDDGVRMIVKTQNQDWILEPAQQRHWDELSDVISRDDRIVVVNETVMYEDLLKLKQGCDCYVSLHKSEGLGFGLIEAMSLGVPVLCTAYSGNMAFCSSDTSWLVDYREVVVEPDEYIFVSPGQRWAEPDLESAAFQMTAVRTDETQRVAKAAAARRNVQENFSAAAIGRQYEQRLDEIFQLVGDRNRDPL